MNLCSRVAVGALRPVMAAERSLLGAAEKPRGRFGTVVVLGGVVVTTRVMCKLWALALRCDDGR